MISDFVIELNELLTELENKYRDNSRTGSYDNTINELVNDSDDPSIPKKKILKTFEDKSYPTPIGQLEQFEQSENSGLCIPIPEKDEINKLKSVLQKPIIDSMFCDESIIPFRLDIKGFLIRFAYLHDNKTYLLFYHKYSKIFMGLEIKTVMLLKIPDFMNRIILEKLDKFNDI